VVSRDRQARHQTVHRGRRGRLDQAGRGQKKVAGPAVAEFTLSTPDGRRVSLSDFRGRIVLVNFWATWCGPCRVEMPWLAEFYDRYRSRGLEVVGVSVDDGDPGRVARFVHDRNVNYTIVLKDDAVTAAYGGVRQLPQTFFIDRGGRVARSTYGIGTKADLEADIRAALGLPRPSP
jgi:cytochrome c biogenesis protein CcmG/thiol:disulfide interchange protein DsbE